MLLSPSVGKPGPRQGITAAANLETEEEPPQDMRKSTCTAIGDLQMFAD